MNLISAIVNCITPMFKFVYDGESPDQKKQRKITPLFKSDSNSGHTNFSPISILLSKILVKNILKQLCAYVYSSNLMSSKQFGITWDPSTNDLN